MFKRFKKNKTEPKKICAFATGQTVAIEEVPDPVFSGKMMGDGIAIQPIDNVIVAPCDATIKMVMKDSKHAIGFAKDDDGLELLIHVGLDTVNLNGEGFELLVDEQDKVTVGTPLIRYSKELLEEKGINDITMLVITPGQTQEIDTKFEGREVLKADSIIFNYH